MRDVASTACRYPPKRNKRGSRRGDEILKERRSPRDESRDWVSSPLRPTQRFAAYISTRPLLQRCRKRKRISYMKWLLSLAILFSVGGCSAHGIVGFNRETNMVLVRGTLNTGPDAFQKDADEACRGRASLVACEEVYVPDRGTRNLCSYRCPSVSDDSTASNSR